MRWFNSSAPDGDNPLPFLVRAGTAHLYFVSIHPFEDGNITKTSRATATRDLSELVSIGALEKTGQLKGTRYQLNLNIL